jgi:hypothetical protein
MTAVIVIVAVLAVTAPVGLLAIVLSRKQVCPGCNERALEVTDQLRGTEGDDHGGRRPYSLVSFRCAKCDAEWCSYNQRGLITKQAYEQGARSPIPTAIVVDQDPT